MRVLLSLLAPHRVVMSGIQPTGIPHIGNWLGAIDHWKQLQDSCTDASIIVCIADLHSITVPHEPHTLRENILSTAASLLACGIDYKRSVLFQQSAVSAHANLSWLFGCLTSMSSLEHLPQWKQKTVGHTRPSVGLFTYPVLQAADVLLYKATDVPVGDDQLKHIELTRHLAKTFNHRYGQLFPLPTALTVRSRRIKSLRDPTVKMSKSDADRLSSILLTDNADSVRGKLRKAVTDMTPSISYEPETRPGVSNLVDMASALSGCSVDDICQSCRHLDTLGFKNHVADVIIERLRPVSAEIGRLMNDTCYLSTVITEGNAKARQIADNTYDEVSRRIGLTTETTRMQASQSQIDLQKN